MRNQRELLNNEVSHLKIQQGSLNSQIKNLNYDLDSKETQLTQTTELVEEKE